MTGLVMNGIRVMAHALCYFVCSELRFPCAMKNAQAQLYALQEPTSSCAL